MIEIEITPEQLERAKKLYDFTALRGSITVGAANLTGALGEVIVADYFKAKGYTVEEKANFDYDLIINGFTVDVKTIKTKSTPSPNFIAQVQAFNTKQKTNYYFFCYLLADYSKVFIAGYLKKEQFFKVAKFFPAGSDNPLSYNKSFRFKADSYLAYIKDLSKFK